MSDATEPKVKPPSLLDAIDFTSLVIKEQIKLVLYAVELLASGIYTLDDTSSTAWAGCQVLTWLKALADDAVATPTQTAGRGAVPPLHRPNHLTSG